MTDSITFEKAVEVYEILADEERSPDDVNLATTRFQFTWYTDGGPGDD